MKAEEPGVSRGCMTRLKENVDSHCELCCPSWLGHLMMWRVRWDLVVYKNASAVEGAQCVVVS